MASQLPVNNLKDVMAVGRHFESFRDGYCVQRTRNVVYVEMII